MIEIISIVVGIGGFLFGLIQYEENKKLKRQEIIFPLTKEFEESDKLKNAKLILDGFILDARDPYHPERTNWQRKELDRLGKGYYRKNNLNTILRVPKNYDKISDPGEMDIRNSFDSLLDFFGKLGYLIHIKIITRKEIIYFQYYIDKIIETKDVRLYISEQRLNFRTKNSTNLFHN